MPTPPGAIILIIYYILRKSGNLHGKFEAEFLHNKYMEYIKDDKHIRTIKFLIKEYKKHSHGEEKTLENKDKLRNWLYLHTYNKEILWFDEEDGKFKLKEEYFKFLEGFFNRPPEQ